MNAERLAERRKWFRVFPEGTLEFAIITRILALFLLLALSVVGGTQRPMIVMGLIFVLWVDYALLIWWLLQVALDLRMLMGATDADTPTRRAKIFIKAILPSIAAVIALVPWQQLMLILAGGTSMPRWIPLAAGLAFVILCVPALRGLREAQVGSGLWAVLLLVPILQWPASHRLAGNLHRRICEQLQARTETAVHPPRAAMAIADVTWVLGVLPWATIAGYVLVQGWSGQAVLKFGMVCGTVFAAFFAIANLAAMEAVQRQLVALIRKSS